MDDSNNTFHVEINTEPSEDKGTRKKAAKAAKEAQRAAARAAKEERRAAAAAEKAARRAAAEAAKKERKAAAEAEKAAPAIKPAEPAAPDTPEVKAAAEAPVTPAAPTVKAAPVKQTSQAVKPAAVNAEKPSIRKGSLHGGKGRKRTKMILLIDLLLLLCVVCVLLIGRLASPDRKAVLTLVGDAEMTVEVGSEFTDPGTEPDKASAKGDVDTSVAGTYTIEYTWRGQTVTRTVYVVEAGSMVMGLKGSEVQIVKQGDKYIENGAFAISKSGGALDGSEINVSGEVDTSTPGDYTVKYSAVSGSASGSVTRTVRVLSPDEFGDTDNEVSVLMYNHVYSAEDRPSNLTGNWILDTDLEEQVKFLSENGYYYPGWKELRAWIDGEISLPAKSIVVTFDGGKKDFLKHGAPLFEEYRIPVTVFMACWEKNAGAEKIVKYASPYIDFESHSYAMAQGGQSRGYRGIVADMSKDEIKEDLEKAHKIIGNNDAFSYPYGDVTSDCIEALQEQGILCAFITDYGRVRQGMDPYRLPRVRVLGDQSFQSWRQSVR